MVLSIILMSATVVLYTQKLSMDVVEHVNWQYVVSFVCM